MAASIPLRLRALDQLPHRISRSAFRWSVADGQPFRKGDVLGYCNLGLAGDPAGQGHLFGSEEGLDLQVALIARGPGLLHHVASLHGGGWSDRQPWYQWEPRTVLANVEPATGDGAADWPDGELIDYHFVTGRRAVSLAEDRSGLATGWHDRLRAWRLNRQGPSRTVLGLGSCELFHTLRGDQGAFVELIDGEASGIHMVDVPERPIIHSARMIVEQMRRTDAERAAMEQEFRASLAACPVGGRGTDWSFALFSLLALQRCPVRDRYDVLTEGGAETVGPADAVILSIVSEQSPRLRHRRHGFLLDCRTFLYPGLGEGMKDWLRRNFEFVEHGVEDAKRDYLELVRELRRLNPDLRVMVLNAVSTRGSEDIISYSAYDEPLGLRLASVRAREMNAMLDDVAREAGISIVDCDSIAAELGCSIAVPDGVHQNGEMQAMLRQEIRSELIG